MEVWYLAEAARERNELSSQDRVALAHAVEKLELCGAQLPAPHQKNVVGADRIRELRPRAGRSQFRAFYRQIEQWMLIGAVGPEYGVDPKGFRLAVRHAEDRLNAFEEA
jgi:hypothetical protein